MNATIDEAARGRGPQSPGGAADAQHLRPARVPAAVRPRWMAERLAALTLEHGTSTFILGPGNDGDPDELPSFRHRGGPRPSATSSTPSGPIRWLRCEATLATSLETNRPQPSPPWPPHPSPPPTPDDGVRLSATLPWDESKRPSRVVPENAAGAGYAQPGHPPAPGRHPRPTCATSRPRCATSSTRYAAAQLTVGAARSAVNTMTMRQNNWTLGANCQLYCRIVTGHHTLEDHSVFTHLRRSEPDLAAVLDRLQDRARGHPRRPRAGRSRAGRPGRRPVVRRGCRRPPWRNSSAASICSPTRCCPTSPTRSAS